MANRLHRWRPTNVYRALGRRFSAVRDRLRRPQVDWPQRTPSPWARLPRTSGAVCNICRWTGRSFNGRVHSEGAQCPRCGSIARDRFLLWSMVSGTADLTGRRLLETSPRLGHEYRAAMARWFDYTCSDYDQNSHRGTLQLDLQQIDLPDSSVDIILTPHVLEHVPDTGLALDEIRRILTPGGRMYLQVPVLQGATAPPERPEFHGDNTPVFWRFGFDLTTTLGQHGFDATVLCTDAWRHAVAHGWQEWPTTTWNEFDVSSMLAAAPDGTFRSIATRRQTRRLGFEPAYMFLTFECIRRP